MRPYSCDFRQKILDAYRNGEGSIRDIAERFSVSSSCVWLLLKRYYSTGAVDPKPHTGGRVSVMTPHRLEMLRCLVEEKNDSTLEELRDGFHRATGVLVSCGTISMALKKLGFSRKKKTFHATEMEDRAEIVEERIEFIGGMPAMDAQHLVFVDEFGINLGMEREYARAEIGQRAEGHRPCDRGRNVTVIVGLSLCGIIAALMFPGGVNGRIFNTYIEKLLLPELKPGDMVLMDNVSSHKVDGIQQGLEGTGAKLGFLPRYSPDLSPVENAISKMKEKLKGIAARTYEELVDAMKQAMEAVLPSNAVGWFKGCGYCVKAG